MQIPHTSDGIIVITYRVLSAVSNVFRLTVSPVKQPVPFQRFIQIPKLSIQELLKAVICLVKLSTSLNLFNPSLCHLHNMNTCHPCFTQDYCKTKFTRNTKHMY